MAKTNNDNKGTPFFNLSTTRLEALSDGVFAIAMTLLVLELSVPYFIGTGNTEHPTSFSEMQTEFLTYAVGFLSLGIYWTLHQYIFNFIKRSDGLLVWLNITFLALASLVPFWTQVLNSNKPGLVTFYYAIYMIISLFVLLSILYYATIGYRLVDQDIDQNTISFLKKILLIGSFIVAVASVIIYLTYTFFTQIAYVLQIGYLFLIPAAFFIIATIYICRRPKKINV